MENEFDNFIEKSEYNFDNLVIDEKLIKNYCAWCLLPLKKDEKRYRQMGNMCSNCSGLVNAVVNGYNHKIKWKRPDGTIGKKTIKIKMPREEADERLLEARQKNIVIYDMPENRKNNEL